MVRSIDLKFWYDALLGSTGPCAKFQFDRIMGNGSFLTSVFPPARRAQDRERDGREVNIRDLKICVKQKLPRVN